MAKWLERGVAGVSQLILNTDDGCGNLPLGRDNIVKRRGSSQLGIKKKSEEGAISVKSQPPQS